jgi:Transglycosylase SLT domain
MTDPDRIDLPTPGTEPRLGDRRQQNRRIAARADKSERRRSDRRRRGAAGGLLLTGLALAGALYHGSGSGAGDPTSEVASDAADRSASDPPADKAAATDHFDALIQEASIKYGVDPNLVRAVIRTESNFNPLATSRVGAKGLMQLMPKLAKELGISDVFNPRENIFGGVKYLSKLLDRHDGDVSLALASFNAGPRNVLRYKGIPPFKETRGYVKKITNLMAANTTSGDQGRGAAD